MAPQLSFLDHDVIDRILPALSAARHLNHDVSDFAGLQEVEAVSGLKFVENFLMPAQQDYCVQQVDAAVDQVAQRPQPPSAALRLALRLQGAGDYAGYAHRRAAGLVWTTWRKGCMTSYRVV